MSGWKRSDAARLSLTAMQTGLDVEEADQALMIGARFMAHGFTGVEIDRAIRDRYVRLAEDQEGK